jgi:hypothetical protein
MYVLVKQQMSTPCYIVAQSPRNGRVKFLNISIQTSIFPPQFKVRTNFNMAQPQKCPLITFLVTGPVLFTLLPSQTQLNVMMMWGWQYLKSNKIFWQAKKYEDGGC